MTRLVNVIRRTGRYHFRRAVPRHLRDRLSRCELVKSLETFAPTRAKLHADLLYRASERLFGAAASPMFSRDQLAQLVRDFYDIALEADDATRLHQGPIGDDDFELLTSFYDQAPPRLRRDLGRNKFHEAELATTVVLRRAGVPIQDLGSGDLAQVQQAILRASVDVVDALRARYDGDYDYEPKDKLLVHGLTLPRSAPRLSGSSCIAATGELPARPSSGPGHQPLSDAAEGEPSRLFGVRPEQPTLRALARASPTAPLMSAVGAAFRTEQVATRTWDRQTANQAGASYRLFVAMCGDKPLQSYTRTDADHFRKLIQRLPGNYSKAVRYRGLNVEKIIDAFEAIPTAKRSNLITQRTVKRHFSALSGLWSSALTGGDVEQNIFSGFRFAAKVRASEQRAMWTASELTALFSGPIWTGCQSRSRRSEPGTVIVLDERYWLPLIAVFSGMRQEEISQLHIEDVCDKDGITYFDLNDRPPRMLKNANAVRLVPVHNELIRLGLLDYVATCRRQGETRLFPALRGGGADDRLGHAFSKWFTRYRRDVGLYRRGLDFHSFRHTATTLMHQAGVERAVIDHVTGHGTPGETSRYTKGSTLKQLRSAIEAIDVGCELTESLSAKRTERLVLGTATRRKKIGTRKQKMIKS